MTNVLIANNHLFEFGGSETFTYTLIEEINNRDDYNVEYYTLHKGTVSEKIEKILGVKYLSRKRYDLILASHNTCVEMLYSMGFCIQICHGIYPQLEQPSNKADAFVSISQEIQDYLSLKGYSSRIIYNGINLERFRPLKPISSNLKTVLSLCHSEEANNIIEQICLEKKIKFIKAFKYKDPVWDIERLINKSDLVIGLGRSAYEAMACGRPVIVYDNRNYFHSYCDGYVKNILGFSLLNNCSGRYSKKVYSINDLKLEFEKYDFKDSEYFRNFAEKHLDIKNKVDEILEYASFLKKNSKKINRYLVISLTKLVMGNKNFKTLIKLKS